MELTGEDLIVQDLERELAAINQHISVTAERRSELSVVLSQATRDRDVISRKLASIRRVPEGERR